MKNRIKLILYLLVLIFITLTIVIFKKSYALYENNASGVVDNTIGRWIIKVSDQLITTGQTEDIVVDSFIYEQKSTIENGYIAPGSSAYFDLVFDATLCDVAVKYDITINYNSINYADNISINVQELGQSSTIMTGPNTYSGVISLASIENEDLVTLRVTINWNDLAAYNDSDTELGVVQFNKLIVPITVNAVQYLGETLTPYDPTSLSGNGVFSFVNRQSANTVTAGDVINITNYGNFYVLSTNSSKTKLLPYYNVNVGPDKISTLNDYGQDSNLTNGRGQLIYSNSDYWTSHIGTTYTGSNNGGPYPYVFDNNSNLYQYATGYATILTSLGFTGVDVKLLSFEEATSLFNSNNNLACGSTFWLGSSRYGSIYILEAASTCEIKAVAYNAASGRGFRPTVSIDTDNLL